MESFHPVTFALPAPCVGHVLGKGVGSCPQNGSVALLGIIVGSDGGPTPVIITACPQHVRGARLWISSHGVGDEITTWATQSLAEHWGTVTASGLDFHRLLSA